MAVQLIDALPKRCPVCGRDVPAYFDHIDVNCENWPDRDAKLPTTYRDFVIDFGTVFGYEFAHVDYDGPEDNRCGHEMTVDGCYRSIDERLDE